MDVKFEVDGLDWALKVSGFPMTTELDEEELTPPYEVFREDRKTLDRADKLSDVPKGSGHDTFLKGINVRMMITAPQYWWMQAQRYSFIDIVSSQSKMHKLTEMDVRMMVNEYVDEHFINYLTMLIEKYQEGLISFQYVISNVPMGLELTAGVTCNYLQLKTIYSQRRDHKLDEWQYFCDSIEVLPYSRWITGSDN